MWVITKSYPVLLALIVFQVCPSFALSDKRLCADEKCQTIISLAKGLITYRAPEEGLISFKINSPIRVKSKSAGSDPSLWGIEVNGRQGYAPKEFLREEKIFISEKNLQHIVPVVPIAGKNQLNVPNETLKSSEANTLVNAKESETQTTTTTPPLSSESSAKTEALLNSSESEVESTTTPLPEPINAEVTNQSLKDMATPVVNKHEIIDGTVIPVNEGIQTVEEDEATTKTETNKLENIKNDSKETVDKVADENEDSQKVEINKKIELNETEPETKSTVESTNSIPIKTDKIAKKIDDKAIVNEEINNSIENESKEKESKTEEKQQPVNNKLSFDPYGDDEDADDYDDDEDNDDIDEPFQSSSAEITTPKTIAQVTDSGFPTTSNMNYWEGEEDITTTTPISIIDEKPITTTNSKVDKINEPKNKENEPIQESGTSEEIVKENGTENSAEILQENTVQTETALENNTVTSEEILKENVAPNITTPLPQDNKEATENSASDLKTTEPPQVPNLTTKETPPAQSNHLHEASIPHEETKQNEPTHPEAYYDPYQSLKQQNNDLEKETKGIALDNKAENKPATEQSNEITNEKVLEETKTNEQPQVPSTATIPNEVETQKTQAEKEQVEQKESQPTYEAYYDPYQNQNQENKPQELQQDQRFAYNNPNDYYNKQAEQIINQDTTQPAVKPNFNEEPASTENIESTTMSAEINEKSAHTNVDSEKNVGDGSVEMLNTPAAPVQQQTVSSLPLDEKREAGLFGTILGTVNNFVNKLRKETAEEHVNDDDELQRILYPDRFKEKAHVAQEGNEEYCEKLSPHSCPKNKMSTSYAATEQQQCHQWADINMDNFVEIFVAKAFEMREMLSVLTIASSTILLFLFGYYCFCNSSREGALISKLNLLERSLLASHKENAILKDDLHKTRNKLSSIEDNSFGSNDMVIAIRKELTIVTEEKRQLQEQIVGLEKELETAAEAGLELNKIVAELLNNQTGQESMIMNSVEDLQMQFNEQQKTILEINANLAEKSRENSELQLMLAEQNVRFEGEIASLQQDNDELEAEKSNIQTRLDELKAEFEEDITKALEGKNAEIKRLQSEIVNLKNRYEDIHTKWQTSLAKIEALEDCMKTLKKDSNVNINDVINVANVRAELLDLQKQRSALKSRLDVETEARQHAENSLQNTISEVDKLKQDFHQSEKDKLEAQTRLEVLSNYFKEKETQLQKELSLKEAIWLKQQGENTSTVERLTAMQDEIQSLKSQNDALRAEIEAQLAAHKAQTGTLENRAHETWLAARQSERRFEEARAEAAALRRRLTELAGNANGGSEGNRTVVDGKLVAPDFNNAPSPIMPLPPPNAGSPLLGNLPPPPHTFLPFMGPPPPPFMNLPPPPFMQSVEMRPAPLGRMMSPTSGRYSPPPPPPNRERKRRGNDYYDERESDDDYDSDDHYEVEEDDYDDYDDEHEERRSRSRERRVHRRSGNGSDSEWQRDRYSPPPPDRSYRSQSPTDSRYNYTYDEETDLSPPPSPSGRRRDGSRTSSYHTYSPRMATNSSPNVIQEKTSKKGIPNSDSDKSHNSTHHNKKGKSLV